MQDIIPDNKKKRGGGGGGGGSDYRVSKLLPPRAIAKGQKQVHRKRHETMLQTRIKNKKGKEEGVQAQTVSESYCDTGMCDTRA